MKLSLVVRPVILSCGALAACGDSKPTDPGTNGNGSAKWDTSTVSSANVAIRMLARDNYLYTLDVSTTPIKRLSLLIAGPPTPVLTPLPTPQGAAADAQAVYWTARGSVYRTFIFDGSTTLLASGDFDKSAGATAEIVLDGTHAYFVNTVANGACSPACTFTIRRVPMAGGAAITIATTSQTVVGLGVAAGHVFWEERGLTTNSDGSTGSAIRKAPVTGGSVTTVANGLLNGLITPPAPGNIRAAWRPVGGIEVDHLAVFFGDSDPLGKYRILRVSIDGGTVTPLTEITTGAADNVVRDIEQDDVTIYWIDKTSLKKVFKAGGLHATLPSPLNSPLSLERSGNRLFWLETVCCAHRQKGTVMKADVAGGPPEIVKADIDSPIATFANGSQVFWLEGGPIGEIEGFGRIGSMSFDGSGAMPLVESADISDWSTLVPRVSGFFDIDATHLYFVEKFTVKRVPRGGGKVERLAIGDFYGADIATDGAHVYWVEAGLATVRRVPVGGGTMTTVSSGNGKAGAMTMDATHVYWSVGDNSVIRAPKSGGAPTPVTGSIPGGLTDFLVAAGTLYFAEWDGGGLRKVPVAGGAPQLLIQLQPDQTRRIMLSGTRLFWVDQRDVASVALSGGLADYIVENGVASSPFLAGDIAASDGRIYWSEVASGIIKRAVPVAR